MRSEPVVAVDGLEKARYEGVLSQDWCADLTYELRGSERERETYDT